MDEALRKTRACHRAAAGLGRAVALRFAREGAVVVAADKNDADGASLAEKFRDLGHEEIFVRTDASESVRCEDFSTHC